MRKFLSTMLIVATAITGLIVSGSSPADAVGSDGAAAPSAPAVDVPRKLNNINGYRLDGAGCLLAKDGGFDGAPLVMHQCLNFADQQWRLILDPTGFLVQIRNEKSGLCLVARTRSDSVATVTACNTRFLDQLWIVETIGKWSRFDNANSGLCLTARTHSIAIQTTCSSFLDQWWSPDDVD